MAIWLHVLQICGLTLGKYVCSRYLDFNGPKPLASLEVEEDQVSMVSVDTSDDEHKHGTECLQSGVSSYVSSTKTQPTATSQAVQIPDCSQCQPSQSSGMQAQLTPRMANVVRQGATSSEVTVEMPTNDADQDEGLRPASSQAMLENVANDPSATFEQSAHIPWGFSPRVEAAFQAQHTNSRVFFGIALCIAVGIPCLGNGIFSSPSNLPRSAWLVMAGTFLLTAFAMACNRHTLQEYHNGARAVAFAIFVLFYGALGYVLVIGVNEGSFADCFTGALTTGMAIAGGILLFAHLSAPLWTFSVNAFLFVLLFLLSPESFQFWWSTVFVGPMILFCAAWQILLQQRHSFTAQVSLQPIGSVHSNAPLAHQVRSHQAQVALLSAQRREAKHQEQFKTHKAETEKETQRIETEKAMLIQDQRYTRLASTTVNHEAKRAISKSSQQD